MLLGSVEALAPHSSKFEFPTLVSQNKCKKVNPTWNTHSVKLMRETEMHHPSVSTLEISSKPNANMI